MDLAREEELDVAILDLGLPVMDGFALAQAIRSLPRTASLRLIAVTGYGQEEDRARTRRAGFDHHFVKPVDAQKLIEAVRSLVVNIAGGSEG